MKISLEVPGHQLIAFTEVSLNLQLIHPLNNSFSKLYWVPIKYHGARC